MKTRKYAIWYTPKRKGFTVYSLKKNEMVRRGVRGVSIVRASSGARALDKLSRKNYYFETGKRLSSRFKKR